MIKIKNIKLIKNYIFKKERLKYLIMLIFIILMLAVTTIYNTILYSRKGLVINSINMDGIRNKDKIRVYINGEVNKPGYIDISKGKNLEYAINKLGGITNKADIQNLNLKRKLKNGEKIIIPIKSRYISDEIENISESKQLDKININAASKEELLKLEGIGSKTAEKIVEHRKNNKFKNIEDIKEIKGIGDTKFNKIKDYITI